MKKLIHICQIIYFESLSRDVVVEDHLDEVEKFVILHFFFFSLNFLQKKQTSVVRSHAYDNLFMYLL